MTNTLRYFCGWGLEYFPHFPFCLFNRDGLSLSFSFPVKSLKCILHQNTMSKDVKSYRAYIEHLQSSPQVQLHENKLSFISTVKMVLHFSPNMRAIIDMSRKLKFKVQFVALHFQIVKILSCLFSPGSALTSEGKSFIISPVTGNSSLSKRLRSPSFDFSCTWGTETKGHFNCLWICPHLSGRWAYISYPACTDLPAGTPPAKGPAAWRGTKAAQQRLCFVGFTVEQIGANLK